MNIIGCCVSQFKRFSLKKKNIPKGYLRGAILRGSFARAGNFGKVFLEFYGKLNIRFGGLEKLGHRRNWYFTK